MALVGALLLVLFLLLRPMELWPEIAQLHSLEVLSAITALGIASEKASGRRAAGSSPQLGWLAAFVGWAYAVSIARLGVDSGLKAAWSMTLGPIFMVLMILALPALGRLRAMAALLLGCAALVSAVAVHQGGEPRQCVELHEVSSNGTEHDVEPVPDGRECAGALVCETDGVPGSDYVCERVGMFGTMSTQGRVRWRGQLDDPNEVAVLIAALLPFLFMFGTKRSGGEGGEGGVGSEGGEGGEGSAAGRFVTLLVLGLLFGLALWAVVLTQSRGGQLVLGAVIVGILVRRFGWWSVIVGVAVTLPVVLLSWRADADAASSSMERAEILSEGLQMLKAHPFIGIGVGQFAGENPLNMAAHNSYLLIATEIGLPGYLLWCGLVWMTMKIPIVIALRPPPGLHGDLLRFAEALSVSMIALHVGIFFLSFVYKHIFFVWLALAGALYGAVRSAHPELTIRTTRRDLMGICVMAGCALVAVRIACLNAR